MFDRAADGPSLTSSCLGVAGASSESDQMWLRRAKEHMAQAEDQLAEAEAQLVLEQVRVERAEAWLAQSKARLAEAWARVADRRELTHVWREEVGALEVAGNSPRMRAAAGGRQ